MPSLAQLNEWADSHPPAHLTWKPWKFRDTPVVAVKEQTYRNRLVSPPYWTTSKLAHYNLSWVPRWLTKEAHRLRSLSNKQA